MLTLENVSVNYGAIEALTGISMQAIREWRTRANVPRIYAAGFLDGAVRSGQRAAAEITALL